MVLPWTECGGINWGKEGELWRRVLLGERGQKLVYRLSWVYLLYTCVGWML